MTRAQAISILLVVFLCFSFLFLSVEFQSSKQSYNVSKKALTEDDDPQTKIVLILIDAAKYSYASELNAIKNNLGKEKYFSELLKCKIGMPTMTTQRI